MKNSQNYLKNTRKNRQEDWKKTVLEAVSKDLDLRSRWFGIEELKSKYNPIPYHNKTKEGEHIKLHDRAQKAAEYFSRERWGLPNQDHMDLKEARRPKFENNKITSYYPLEKYYIIQYI